MPLIRPEIQNVLRNAGLLDSEKEDNLTVDEKLTQAGLNNESIAEELTSLALHSQNESLRLRALETVLKVRGALKEQPSQLPTFNIIIQGSTTSLEKTEGVNPIVFPRQSLNLKSN